MAISPIWSSTKPTKTRPLNLQEVVYYFSLPELAVITGLWLGNSPDKAKADVYQVAPRGAAQAVYREETREIPRSRPG